MNVHGKASRAALIALQQGNRARDQLLMTQESLP
jgi:hypothetical protein